MCWLTETSAAMEKRSKITGHCRNNLKKHLHRCFFKPLFTTVKVAKKEYQDSYSAPFELDNIDESSKMNAQSIAYVINLESWGRYENRYYR